VEARGSIPRRTWLPTALRTVGPFALAVGVLIFFIVQTLDSTGEGSPLPAVPEAPAVPKVDQTIEPVAREVAGKFILTAVARKNIGASWALLDPTYMGKDEFTKKQWAKGDIPVAPYPVGSLEQALFRVSARTGKMLQLEVALIPKKGSKLKSATFDLGLTRRGDRWLVDYWATSWKAGRRPPAE
jgi:hypothetical protein